ncbi:MAG TPA: disulfide bond formation protein B [Gammaproteobacteria bacterium]|jgi:disulfide bond formation protein DsbB|nr:disulfide bond formation protein B [Gammaproteobacteria bacterium]
MSAAFGKLGVTPDARMAALAAMGLAGLVLAIGQIMEHAFGHVPCPLCLMQRLWFLIAGLVAALALADDPRRPVWALLLALAALVGGAFSIRQLWLQSLPADQVPACTPPIDFMLQSGYPGMEIIRAMTSGTGDCAKVGWSLLGLSFAGWALVGFLALVALALLQHRLRRA